MSYNCDCVSPDKYGHSAHCPLDEIAELRAENKALVDKLGEAVRDRDEAEAATAKWQKAATERTQELNAAMGRLDSALSMVREVLAGTAEPCDWNPRARVLLGVVESLVSNSGVQSAGEENKK